MSLYDYQASREIDLQQAPFCALIMAAMRQADSENAARLQEAFPLVWDELQTRYHARGGLLPGEHLGG